ncbi:MAG: Piwi domain-containing protein [Bryobacterales bacterium]|nr:Piwi domain-containing protein [Bryobacterales bacterium]
MRRIALNLLPILTQDFRITVYAVPPFGEDRPEFAGERAVLRHLPDGEEYVPYWTFFEPVDGAKRVDLYPFDNTYATIAALRRAIEEKCRTVLKAGTYRVKENFRRHIEVVVERHKEGVATVSLEPYLLRSTRRFGILLDFRFHPAKGLHGTRRALQLSLALDRNGQPNLDFYADRYAKLSSFIRKYYGKIFPLKLSNDQEVEVGSRLVGLNSDLLARKRYVMNGQRQSKSQFMGVNRFGPYKQHYQDAQLYFLYRRAEHGLSQDLFRALRGDVFRTFSGLKQMFAFPVTRENVRGATISTFEGAEIDRIAQNVLRDANGRPVVPVVITPFSRRDEKSENDAYWRLKHSFLSRGIPIQVVAAETIANRNTLKWSTSGIALQIFAKAGGTPWRVVPTTEQCLIVGVGQAHSVREEGGIKRFFAYSVLTDSTGAFQEIRQLGAAEDEDSYIGSFHANLRQIFEDYADRFSSYVVHSTFSIRGRELDSIAATLSDHREMHGDGHFVSMKFNDRNPFFGFDSGHNSRVPYESTVVPLSRSDYLVWFEGLQYGQLALHKMVGGPLHVRFAYPKDIAKREKRMFLQDAINLSGANWRGFNAKSLPVSVYYAQIIARYLKEFEARGLQQVDVNNIVPWFL